MHKHEKIVQRKNVCKNSVSYGKKWKSVHARRRKMAPESIENGKMTTKKQIEKFPNFFH